METEWNNIKKTQPEDEQRVLTWNTKYNNAFIQVYNEYFQCWDDEDGDDYQYDLEDAPYWIELPKQPENL